MKVIEDLPKSKLNSGDLKMKVTTGRVQRPAKSRENRIQTRILKQDLAGSFENKEVRIYYNYIFACHDCCGHTLDHHHSSLS